MKILSFWTFRLGLLLIIVLGITFYLVLGRGARESVTEDLLNQQQLVARAETGNITTFFEKHGDSLATLAQLKSIEARDKDTAYDLDIFMEQRKDTGIIGGVILTDKAGVVEYNSNITGVRDLGQSVADRNYFVWAKSEAKRGEYYISRSMVGRIGAVKGQTVIAVASPVYKNGVFTGVLSSSVKVKPLVERFFGLMKISDKTRVYLINENGDLIYNYADPEAFGTSIDSLFSDDQALSSRIKNVLTSEEDGQFSTDKYLVAYSPLELGVQKWLLIITSPTQEAMEETIPFYIRQTVMFIVTSLIILLVSMIAVRKQQV